MAVNYQWLKDFNQMHQYLQTQISGCTTFNDLLPFLQTLIDENELKNQLSSRLHKLYQKGISSNQYSSPFNKIRSLFIKTNQMNNIPSQDIQANIISFLSAKEHSKICVVSKNFNNIMQKYAHIYVDNDYQIRIYDNAYKNKPKQWKIIKSHVLGTISLKPIAKLTKLSLSIQKIPIPFNKIKIWQFTDKYRVKNAPICSHHNLLSKYNINIYSLRLYQIQNATKLIKNIFKLTFPNCLALQIFDVVDTAGFKHWRKQTFHNLLSLELTYLNPKQINNILLQCPQSLICLSVGSYSIELNVDFNRHQFMIEIPKNIQWLKIDQCYKVKYDLTECNQLIGMVVQDQLLIDADHYIIWPQKYIIPYIRIDNDIIDMNQEERSILSDDFPIKLVSFKYKSEHTATFKRVNIEDFNLNKGKCLVLKDNQINEDCIWILLKMVVTNTFELRNATQKVTKLMKLNRMNMLFWFKDMFEKPTNKNTRYLF